MTSLAAIAPAFVEMAHRIVWCTVATVDRAGRPWTRILHPVWEWDASTLTGWIATDPTSPKRAHVDAHPVVSLTYWDPSQDTATAQCTVHWELGDDEKRAGWERFASAPAPVGYDPRIIPQWTAPEVERFGILRLEPHALRVLPGSVMTEGRGELLTWHA